MLPSSLLSPRLAGDLLSPRLRASPFSSNCHACDSSAPSRLEGQLSPRLAGDLLSPRFRASPFSSNCHACGINPALASRRPETAAQLEQRAPSRLEDQLSPRPALVT